jgi:aryl-phospho-beta-D-glucosidase BglC (GH1 family)
LNPPKPEVLPRLRSATLLLICMLPALASLAQSAPQSFETLFATGFDNRRDLRAWDKRPPRRAFRLVRDSFTSGNKALRLRNREVSSHFLQKSFPAEAVAGRKLHLRLRLRNPGITPPPRPASGLSIALRFTTPQGEQYAQLPVSHDTAAWTSAGFTALVPPETIACDLLLSLTETKGEALYDDLELRLFARDSNNLVMPSAQVAKGLRGAMITTYATAEDLRTLASWGANHVRWQLTWNGFPATPADTASLVSYRQWLDGALAHVKSLLPLCDSLHLRVLLDLHTLPGGRFPGFVYEHRMLRDIAWQTAFRDIWKDIAMQFRSQPALWGYDLANEPIEGLLPNFVLDWQSLAAVVAADIRSIDTTHAIIVEAAPGGGPLALSMMNPLRGVHGAVYSLHMYEPLSFTGQNIHEAEAPVQYPGVVNGKYWDKDSLRKVLQPLRDWQQRHGTEIYVGEFSAVRWAPGSSAYSYIRDCISIFEEWYWSWAYHAFREWGGWSVEHDSDATHHEPARTPTDRQLLLMEAFGRNKR